jgi:hypothetical protein
VAEIIGTLTKLRPEIKHLIQYQNAFQSLLPYKPVKIAALVYCFCCFMKAIKDSEWLDACLISQYWQDTAMLDYNPDARDVVVFDVKTPRVWKLVPNDEDEAALLDTALPAPVGPTELRAWEVVVEFDKLTKDFGSMYKRWFVNDSLYELLGANSDGAVRFFKLFIERRDTAIEGGLVRLQTKGQQECEDLLVFMRGYVGMMRDEIFDAKHHEPYEKAFLEEHSPIYNQFRQLRAGCAKDPKFKVRVNELLHGTPVELDYYLLVQQCEASMREDGDNFDHAVQFGSYTAKLFGKIRGPAGMRMLRKCADELGPKVETIMHPSCLLEPRPRVELLGRFDALFTELPLGTDPAVSRTISALKIKIAKVHKMLFAQLATDSLQGLASKMDDAFILGTDFVNTLESVTSHSALHDAYVLIMTRLVVLITEKIRELPSAPSASALWDSMYVALANFTRIEVHCPRKSKLAIKSEQVKLVLDRGRKMQEAGDAYNAETSSRQKFTHFNRAIVEWSGVKVKEDDADIFRQLAFAVVSVCNDLKIHYNAVVKENMERAREILMQKVVRVQMVARGGMNNENWHRQLTPTMTVDEVLKIADGPQPSLLHVPDADAAELKNGKNTLVKARLKGTKPTQSHANKHIYISVYKCI